MIKRKGLVIFFGFMIVLFGGMLSLAQEFSLDDDPSAPVNGMTVPPYRSAEDEFGVIYSPPPANSPCGGSPSLGQVFIDSNMLMPGPVLSFPIPPLLNVDSVSAEHSSFDMLTRPLIALIFSVDRNTSGVAGSPLNVDAALNDHSSTIYRTVSGLTHPGSFAGTLAPAPFAGWLPTVYTGNGHQRRYPAALGGLKTGMGYIPADNIDAYNEFPFPLLYSDFFFTTHPVEIQLNGNAPADIHIVPAGSGVFQVFALAGQMGLDSFWGPNSDSIDALIVWNYPPTDADMAHVAEPVLDFALFSLAPGSGTLTYLQSQGIPVDGGSIFFTDFTGTFAFYADSAVDLGLAPMPPWVANISVDALDCY